MKNNETLGGPSFDDCVFELHNRLEEFRHYYLKMHARYPDRFPKQGLIQRSMGTLFARYLESGMIVDSPIDVHRNIGA